MTDTDEATLIWNEYQYRHEHCWKTIFRLTGALCCLAWFPIWTPNEHRVLAFG